MNVTDAMVIAAARALCRRHADACETNEQDTWNLYAEDFKEDARRALHAAIRATEVQP